jgi:hypothetical protein
MCSSWACPRDLPIYFMKLFPAKCFWAESCCCETSRLFSDKKQNYWYWDYSPQVLYCQEFWTIGFFISGGLLYLCIWVCMCDYILYLPLCICYIFLGCWFLSFHISQLLLAQTRLCPLPTSLGHWVTTFLENHIHTIITSVLGFEWLTDDCIDRLNCLTSWIISSQ